jgi:hypothetical protein
MIYDCCGLQANSRIEQNGEALELFRVNNSKA